MKGFLDLPYRLPFAEHYREFDRGFYVDFPKQLKRMGEWLRRHGCRRTLDVGAMTGGCIEYISGLGIRMDGVQFTEDVRRLAAARLRRARIRSTLFVSPVHAPLKVAAKAKYDGIVSLGWFNLPFTHAALIRTLREVRRLLAPRGIFMFDFFQFKELKVEPAEAVKVGRSMVLLSRGERRGKRFLRHHAWLRPGHPPLLETGELVDRTPREARKLLSSAGFEIVKTDHLDLNYPREFWLARKPDSGPSLDFSEKAAP